MVRRMGRQREKEKEGERRREGEREREGRRIRASEKWNVVMDTKLGSMERLRALAGIGALKSAHNGNDCQCCREADLHKRTHTNTRRGRYIGIKSFICITSCMRSCINKYTRK